jgi:NDP-sugar pyrophosphorylase family protein
LARSISGLVWDNLSNCDLYSYKKLHRSADAMATIALFHREDVSASGVVDEDDSFRITRF